MVKGKLATMLEYVEEVGKKRCVFCGRWNQDECPYLLVRSRVVCHICVQALLGLELPEGWLDAGSIVEEDRLICEAPNFLFVSARSRMFDRIRAAEAILRAAAGLKDEARNFVDQDFGAPPVGEDPPDEEDNAIAAIDKAHLEDSGYVPGPDEFGDEDEK